MKVNLVTELGAEQPGYKEIVVAIPYWESYLNDHVDDNELDELRAVGILSLFSDKKSEKIVQHWISKLKHGGKLILGDIETIEVARAFADYRITIDDVNTMLHGENNQVVSSFTINQVANFLESQGLKIIKKRVADYCFVVEAERP